MMEKTIRIPYQIPAVRIRLMLAAAFVLPLIFGYLALTSHSGVRLKFIYFSPSQAVYLYWAFTMACFVAAIAVLYVALQNKKQPGYIEFGAHSVALPQASLVARVLAMPYATIHSVRVIKINGQQILVVKSSLGESRLLPMGFSSIGIFTDVHDRLLALSGGRVQLADSHLR